MSSLTRRLGFAFCLLLVEYLCLSVILDAHQFIPSYALGLGSIGPLPFLAAAVSFAVARPRRSEQPVEYPVSVLRWLLHAAACAAWIASAFWAAKSISSPRFAVWVSLTLCLVASAVWATLPFGALLPWLQQRRGAAIGGLAVGFVAFLSGLGAQNAFEPLAQLTLHPVLSILRSVNGEVIVDIPERVIGTPNFLVHIAPSCSGYEGMGLVSALLIGLLVARRRDLRWPRALLVIPFGITVAWLLNVFRIVLLIQLGDAGFEGLAQSGFHSKIGWILFTALGLALLLWVPRSSIWMRTVTAAPDPGLADATQLHLLPLFMLFASGLMAGLFLESGWLLYAIPIGAAGLALVRVSFPPGPTLRRPKTTPVLAGLCLGILWTLGQSPPTFEPHELVVRLVGTTLVIPVVEELGFRGFLLRRLQSADFHRLAPEKTGLFAVVGSSLVFGLMHQRPVAATAAGLIYALIYRRTGRLVDAVAAHAATNAVIATQWVMVGHFGLG